jgi:hypothetical protein
MEWKLKDIGKCSNLSFSLLLTEVEAKKGHKRKEKKGPNYIAIDYKIAKEPEKTLTSAEKRNKPWTYEYGI